MSKAICILVFLLAVLMNGWSQDRKEKSKEFKVNIFLYEFADDGTFKMTPRGDNQIHKVPGRNFLYALGDSSISISSGEEIYEWPISAVQKLKFKRKGNVGKGLAIGLGAAVVTTGVVGLSGGGLGTAVAAFFSGILGPPAGATIGSLVGHTYVINGDHIRYQQFEAELQQFLTRKAP